MYLLINKMFEDEDVSIDTKEIEQSYCPGKFDLSINDKNLPGFRSDEYVVVSQCKYTYVLKVLAQNGINDATVLSTCA